VSEMFEIPLSEPAASIVRCGIALSLAFGLYGAFVLWLTHYFGNHTCGIMATRFLSGLVALPLASITTRLALRYYPAIGAENGSLIYVGALIGAAILLIRLSAPSPTNKSAGPVTPTSPGGGV